MLRVTPNLCHLSWPSEPWSPVLCFSCFALTVPLDTGPSVGEVLWWDIRFHQRYFQIWAAVRHGPPVPVTVFSRSRDASNCRWFCPYATDIKVSYVCAISDLLICLITFRCVSPHMFAQICLIVQKPTVPVSSVFRAWLSCCVFSYTACWINYLTRHFVLSEMGFWTKEMTSSLKIWFNLEKKGQCTCSTVSNLLDLWVQRLQHLFTIELLIISYILLSSGA